jgi:hypothetical protein
MGMLTSGFVVDPVKHPFIGPKIASEMERRKRKGKSHSLKGRNTVRALRDLLTISCSTHCRVSSDLQLEILEMNP